MLVGKRDVHMTVHRRIQGREDERSGDFKRTIVEEPAELRPKSQVTIPKAVVGALGLKTGDRLTFVIHEGEPNQLHVYRMPSSFAGVAPHAYGGTASSAEYIRDQRETWEE
jgi:bifunctional DNA-binding transcriptional regulator/antitoxin component of YhaV-PrlF toxin-antitoxin module